MCTRTMLEKIQLVSSIFQNHRPTLQLLIIPKLLQIPQKLQISRLPPTPQKLLILQATKQLTKLHKQRISRLLLTPLLLLILQETKQLTKLQMLQKQQIQLLSEV